MVRGFCTTLMLVAVVGIWGCSGLGACECSSADLPVVEETPELPFDVRSPEGGELRVTVKPVRRDRVKVTVRNVSNEPVYIPYMPLQRNGRAYYAVLGLERRDNATGEYQTFEGSDFSPGINALPAGESFEYGYILDKGAYRLNIRYSVDPRDAELRNGLHALKWGEEKEQRGRFLDAMAPISIRSHFYSFRL